MNIRRFAILGLLCLAFVQILSAQSDSVKTQAKQEKIKQGWNFGGVPALAYDADLGFLYGVVLNAYDYGDGSNYPNFDQSFFMEISRTTKGTGKNVLYYDNRTLIPDGRMKLEMSYLTEQALDFYGYNGYNSYYGTEYLEEDNAEYISRMYYRHSRELLRLSADFQGKLYGKKLRWLAGFSYYNISVSSVDIDKLNEGQDEDEILPDTASLYDRYVDWGIIPEGQKEGGLTNLLKAGIVYDTRDNEASPQKGIWSEALLLSAPGFLGNKNAYTRIFLSHRQYFTLLPKKVVFAYRLNYQGVIGGEMPFYMMPFFIRSKDVRDGLGGGKTLRGIKRNRIVGDGAVLGNFELRYRFLETVVANQNFSITLVGFTDAAKIVQLHRFDDSEVDDSYGKTREEHLKELYYTDEAVHMSYGLGLYFALNNNFVIAFDYGMANNPQDGDSGLYILLNYLF